MILSPIQACGECVNCRAGLTNICTNRHVLGVDIPGGFADQLVVKETMAYAKPSNMSWRHSAMVEPLSVALHAAEITPIRLMESVAIVGVGTIGLLTLLAAKLKGAGKVMVTDKSEHRLDMARRSGADIVINVEEEDPVAAVRAGDRRARRRCRVRSRRLWADRATGVGGDADRGECDLDWQQRPDDRTEHAGDRHA